MVLLLTEVRRDRDSSPLSSAEETSGGIVPVTEARSLHGDHVFYHQ